MTQATYSQPVARAETMPASQLAELQRQIAKLQTQLTSEQEGRKRAQARATKAERERDELAAIIRTPHWSAAERIAYATIRLQANKQDGTYLATNATTIKRIAASAGLSVRTIDDKLDQFRSEGLLEYETRRWGETQDGKVIAIRNVDKSRGDRYMAETTVTKIPAELPLPLPELGNGKNAERSKATAEAGRKELGRLKGELQALVHEAECPHCNEIGKIKVEIVAKCYGCGSIFTEEQVEYMAQIPKPEQGGEVFDHVPTKLKDRELTQSRVKNQPLQIDFPPYDDITSQKSHSKRKVCVISSTLNPQTLQFESSQRNVGEIDRPGGLNDS